MSHSLRSKIKCLRYKGIITDKDCDRLRKALDNEDVLDKIITEIQNLRNCSCSCSDGIIDDVEDIIDKYRTGSNETQTNEIVYDVGGHMYGAMGGDVIMDILAGKGKE